MCILRYVVTKCLRLKHLFMKSKIKIALDANNKPVIKLDVSNDRDDIRDQLCAQFTQSLNHISSFCTIQCDGQTSDHKESWNNWVIRPIGIEGLKDLQKQISKAISEMERTYPDQG